MLDTIENMNTSLSGIKPELQEYSNSIDQIQKSIEEAGTFRDYQGIFSHLSAFTIPAASLMNKFSFN